MSDASPADTPHSAPRGGSYYRALFERTAVPLFVFATDRSGSPSGVLEVNEAGCRWLGAERRELVGADPEVLARLGQLAQAAGEPGTPPYRATIANRQGAPLQCEVTASWFELDGRRVVLSAVRDVGERWGEQGERQTLEQQLLHSQKLEAIARLAGGVAHDFNNLLTVILQYASLILEDLRPEDPMFADVTEIQTAGQRAASLTRQLLAFSRKSPVEPVVLDLDALVHETQRMLGRIVGEDIVLRTELASAPWQVEADRSHLEQVLANLVLNARDAMPSGGTLQIATARAARTEPDPALPGLPPGDYVTLSVTDDGAGMSPDSLAHVFEPFYTTKRGGKGSGLGLATTHGIVKQAGGDIAVESRLGRGSTFRIFLPRARHRPDEARTPSRSQRKLLSAVTVLVVEDEDAVRGIARKGLEREGHTVLEARNGGEALLIAERFEGSIDAIVTDVVMPEISGPQLVERLLTLRPGLAVVYISGHAEELLDEHGLRGAEVLLLQKPFTRESLGAALQEALARRDGP